MNKFKILLSLILLCLTFLTLGFSYAATPQTIKFQWKTIRPGQISYGAHDDHWPVDGLKRNYSYIVGDQLTVYMRFNGFKVATFSFPNALLPDQTYQISGKRIGNVYRKVKNGPMYLKVEVTVSSHNIANFKSTKILKTSSVTNALE